MKNIKKFINLFILGLTLITHNVLGQTYPAKCVVNKYSVDLNKNLSAGMVTKAKFNSIYVPVSFARLVYNSNGTISLGETFNIGASYVIGSGNATINLDGSTTLSETFYYGIATTFGAAANNNGSVSSLTLGAVGGFNQFSLLAGRDFLQKKFVLGVNYNLAGLPFFNKTTKIQIK